MAAFFGFVSWIFCLRPITWLFSKIFKNKTVLGFILEIFYFILALIYFVFTMIGIGYLTSDSLSDSLFPITALVIGILGTLILGYGIMKYHKTDEPMSETVHDGYEGSYNSFDDTVTVKEKTKESFTLEGFLAVITAPLQILIRIINLILMFRCVVDKNYVCDLAYNYHPEEDSTLKTIFLDIFNEKDY